MKRIRLASLASLALTLTASAVFAAPQAPEDSAPRTEDTRELRRLIHLKSGKVLRAKARYVEGRLEVRSDREWLALPEVSIERVALEKTVLSELRRLERGMDRKDLNRRAALAEWMIGEGLHVEAVRELDRILTRDPDQAGALGVLRRTPPPMALPRTGASEHVAGRGHEELFRFASAGTPVVRELATLALRDEEPASAVLAELTAELGSHSVRRRVFASHALRRLFPGEALRSLTTRAVLDGSEDVRRSAGLALRDAGDPAVVAPLLRALSSSHPKVRENSIEALATINHPVAVESLAGHLSLLATTATAARSGGYRPPASHIFVGKQTAYLQDFDVEVAQGSAIADPTIGVQVEGSVLDVRIIGVTATRASAEARLVRNALSSLTGADPGRSNKAWLGWWERNRGEWLAKNFLPEQAQGTTR